MNLKIYSLLFGLFLFISCDRNETMPNLQSKDDKTVSSEGYTGEVVSLDFTATESGLRSMFPINDNSRGDVTSIRINWQKGQVYDMMCVLYNKRNPNQTSYQFIKGVVTSVQSNKNGTIKYKGNIRLKQGSLKNGDWYMQLFMGLGKDLWDDATKSYKLDERIVSYENKIDIPIASPWIKLGVNGNHVFPTTAVNLVPMGSIFALDIENTLAASFSLKKVSLSTQLFNGLGDFKLGQFSQVGDMPKFSISDTNGNTSFSIDRTIESNYGSNNSYNTKKMKKIYFWAMPNKAPISNKLTGKLYVSKDKYEYGMPIDARYNGGKIIRERTAHTIRMQMGSSDLMITEFFHYNPKGYNYSMIELYNPTYKPIDLSKYSLVRMRKLTTPDGAYYSEPGFQPTDDVKILKDALRQDIYISPDKKDSPSLVVDGRLAKDVHPDHCSGAINRYYIISGNYDKMLPPGKTVILCAGGTYSAYVYWQKPSDYPEAYVGNYIENAKRGGDIHYIIAVDNGEDDNAYQYQRRGGVMQHGQNHVMVLLKGETPIDATGPYSYRLEQGRIPSDYAYHSTPQMYINYNAFTQQIPQFNGGDDHYNLVRKGWDFFPSPYWDNHKRGELWEEDSRWIMVSGKGSGGSKVSSWGTRVTKPDYLDRTFMSNTENEVKFFPQNATPY